MGGRCCRANHSSVGARSLGGDMTTSFFPPNTVSHAAPWLWNGIPVPLLPSESTDAERFAPARAAGGGMPAAALTIAAGARESMIPTSIELASPCPPCKNAATVEFRTSRPDCLCPAGSRTVAVAWPCVRMNSSRDQVSANAHAGACAAGRTVGCVKGKALFGPLPHCVMVHPAWPAADTAASRAGSAAQPPLLDLSPAAVLPALGRDDAPIKHCTAATTSWSLQHVDRRVSTVLEVRCAAPLRTGGATSPAVQLLTCICHQEGRPAKQAAGPLPRLPAGRPASRDPLQL